ncbi:universal stress protein [Desulfobulbus alkaliphilus]|uniref:universal stress protein n=1 Tax=Desulfobulbus alkaliphilus TaxID=869814 RepID=UPI001964E792|nr:universal stress protein [Desulfobulbus alkaliphilus]MBM9535568.1 universal stress protein [Desulfobulbus alkaliphilus]
MVKKILVAFDGSEQSMYSFAYALDLAGNCSSAVQEINVVAVVQLPELVLDGDMDEIIANTTRQYHDIFKELHDQAAARQVQITTEVLVGNPADQVIRYAVDHDIDMIFAGQTGKSEVQSWLMGSVSRRIVIYAPCSVAIIKQKPK